jgi:hypothetical protein
LSVFNHRRMVASGAKESRRALAVTTTALTLFGLVAITLWR